MSNVRCFAVFRLSNFESEPAIAEQLKQYQLDNAEAIDRCRTENAERRASNAQFVQREVESIRRARKRADDEDAGVDMKAQDKLNEGKRARKPVQLAQPRPLRAFPREARASHYGLRRRAFSALQF